MYPTKYTKIVIPEIDRGMEKKMVQLMTVRADHKELRSERMNRTSNPRTRSIQLELINLRIECQEINSIQKQHKRASSSTRAHTLTSFIDFDLIMC
ncbi:hypothetical protein BpHYR1_014376 [Brachionus plicatilis]|uniref:Uncharacterized protein n=1 Tax=Brachionus plicatilis TaxID=10195 RepID=A0A3M7RL49_BRAPC|nr:hypothetical protein BpHYR1_014376 [Brachionus plicatilis]